MCYRSILEEYDSRRFRLSKSDVAHQVATELRLLQRSVDALDEAAAERLGLNRTDLRCLDVVLGGGPYSAGDLAAELRLSPAATTTVIDRLERAGLVSRTRDAANRRRVLVAATAAAHAADREIYRPVGAAGMKALNRFDEAQLATILEFLRTARKVQENQTARITSGRVTVTD
jgi:DNA-binding MarR family transcriptional regulator